MTYVCLLVGMVCFIPIQHLFTSTISPGFSGLFTSSISPGFSGLFTSYISPGFPGLFTSTISPGFPGLFTSTISPEFPGLFTSNISPFNLTLLNPSRGNSFLPLLMSQRSFCKPDNLTMKNIQGFYQHL